MATSNARRLKIAWACMTGFFITDAATVVLLSHGSLSSVVRVVPLAALGGIFTAPLMLRLFGRSQRDELDL
jgi:hypothetical protein